MFDPSEPSSLWTLWIVKTACSGGSGDVQIRTLQGSRFLAGALRLLVLCYNTVWSCGVVDTTPHGKIGE
jgi:hypothetical protein